MYLTGQSPDKVTFSYTFTHCLCAPFCHNKYPFSKKKHKQISSEAYKTLLPHTLQYCFIKRAFISKFYLFFFASEIEAHSKATVQCSEKYKCDAVTFFIFITCFVVILEYSACILK